MDAQQSFQRVGASEPKFVQNCRPAAPADKRDPAWRLLDVTSDNIEVPPTGKDMQPYPEDETKLYYWRDTYWRRRT